MKTLHTSTKSLAAVTLPLLAAFATVHAQVAVDDDNASRAVYSYGISNFENGSTTGGGTGFGGWVFGGNIDAGTDFVVGSSSDNGGSGSIDVAGDSFILTDGNADGNYTDVFRFLDGGDLGIGQTLSFDMDVNFRDGFKGVRVRDTDDSTPLFRLEVSTDVDGAGTDGYEVLDAATGNAELFGNAYSNDTVFGLSFLQTSGSGGEWTVTRSGGLSGSANGTYSGQISSFQLYTDDAGSALENAVIFNNFAVVPEPNNFAMLSGLIALLSLGLLRRRR